MMEDEVCDLIISMITGPIKATELAAKVSVELSERNVDVNLIGKIPVLFERLVKEGKILELEYVLRDQSYRIKSLYFPVGTLLSYNNKVL